MDPEVLQNWAKIKAHLEAVGKTDCAFYRRACRILAGHPDPLEIPVIGEQQGNDA